MGTKITMPCESQSIVYISKLLPLRRPALQCAGASIALLEPTLPVTSLRYASERWSARVRTLCCAAPKSRAARVNVSRPGTGAERSDATLVSFHTPESRYPEWRDLRSWRQRAPPRATSRTVAENPPRDSGPLAPLPAASRFWQQRAYEYNHNATGSWCLHRRPPTRRRHTTSHCLYDPMLDSGHPFSTTACGTKPFKRDPIYPTP